MKSHRLAYNERTFIEIIDVDDGKVVCPVCGFIDVGAPYSAYPAPELEGVEGRASASYVICDSCGCEYGNYDVPERDRSETKRDAWHRLRLRWLIVKNWGEAEIKQLTNLGYTRAQVLSWNIVEEAR